MITVGVDIESINRFKKIINNDNFLNKIFTPKEIDCYIGVYKQYYEPSIMTEYVE